MSIAIDVILALLALFIIVQYTVRGFVKSVFGALKLVLSALLTYVFTPMLFDLSDPKSAAVAYLLVFSASYVILAIIAFIVDKLFKLPILNTLNRFLGFLLGLLCAYVTLACTVLSIVLSFSAQELFGMTAEQIYESTYIYRFFNDFTIFSIAGK